MQRWRTFARRTRAWILTGTLCAISAGFRTDTATIALVTKTIQDVTKKSASSDWAKAGKGELLLGGDQVRTGNKSLAVIKFMDNSIVRVREESELSVGTEGPRGSMLKTIQLQSGSIGFDVRKQQQNELFRLTSPTSVASIRGTKGKWSSGKGFDTLIVTEGLVNLKHSTSNNESDVPAGSIGFSNPDGSVTTRKATAQELADATNAALGGSPKELKLELRDPKGNRKELKLKYQK